MSGASISFSGSASDPDAGDTLSYSWSFGDGATGNGATPTHAYAAAGPFTATLTVTDGHGGSATATASVTITAPPPPVNQKPVVGAGDPQTITLPNTATLTGTATDDGLPVGGTLTILWTKFSGPGTVTFSSAGTPGTIATFTQPGTYVLRLTASDSLLSSSADVTITVAPAVNHSPVAQAGPPQSGDVGVGLTFDGSTSSDPDGDVLTYAWSFGDQTTSTDRKPFHVYQGVGVFTVTLVVTDSHGAVSDAAATTATIAAAPDRAPPVVTLSGPKEALPGAHVTMTAEATDNIGVQSVTLDVNGTDPVELAERTISANHQRS